MVLELDGDRIGELTFFLSTDRLFPLFGLPPRLES
jgi:RNA polymerase sigma-70 factor (ECF subfamily)